MPDSDLDAYDLSLSQDDFSGSANAKFMSACLPTWRKRRYRRQSLAQSPYSSLAEIAAWHCISSINTDDSRTTELYYNFTKLQ